MSKQDKDVPKLQLKTNFILKQRIYGKKSSRSENNFVILSAENY
jgi:hypothetical protein